MVKNGIPTLINSKGLNRLAIDPNVLKSDTPNIIQALIDALPDEAPMTGGISIGESMEKDKALDIMMRNAD